MSDVYITLKHEIKNSIFDKPVIGPFPEHFQPSSYLENISTRSLRYSDRLCGLVVRVPGYRSRGPRFDFRRYQIFREVVGLKRGPLSLMRIIEELLEWKSSGSSVEN
jgi:hypothetical protein